MFIVRFLLLSFCFANLSLQARAESATFHGKTTLKDASYDTLTVNGHFDFDGLNAQKVTAHGHTAGRNVVAKSMVTHGHTSLIGKKISSLRTHGFTDLTDMNIEKLTTHGSLTVVHSSTSSLDAFGKCELYNTTVSQECSITSQSITIKDCTITCNVTIRKSENYNSGWFCSLPVIKWFCTSSDTDQTQILKIQGTTKITGNILFESGKGKVYLPTTATVTGKIIGAEVIRS